MFSSADLLAGNGLVEISEPIISKSELRDGHPIGGDKMKELFQIGRWGVDPTSVSNSARILEKMPGFSKFPTVPEKSSIGKIEGDYYLLQPEGPLNLMEFYMQLHKINFESGGWANQLALCDRSMKLTGMCPEAGEYSKFYENLSATYRAIESDVLYTNQRTRVKQSVLCMMCHKLVNDSCGMRNARLHAWTHSKKEYTCKYCKEKCDSFFEMQVHYKNIHFKVHRMMGPREKPITHDPKLQQLMYQCYGEQLCRFAYAGERICMLFREGQRNDKGSDANSKNESLD
ncbi:hypothetical protein L3Y34_013749 [Caenorhabditis briggsae]|uniref:C2H2-type domain-containing protein n=1 Tax=Caenorhabditis briggsae TaxID=6238 RepID=A0AAE9CWM4_CAEBR|nr:hypothetical protein L3Y34_013749 [Caenorhabditis briggsae]